MPVGIGNQVDVFNKYPNGIYWKDLPENEQWDKDGKCVHCSQNTHIGICHYCHEVIHGAAFHARLEEGKEVYFHDSFVESCYDLWVDEREERDQER